MLFPHGCQLRNSHIISVPN